MSASRTTPRLGLVLALCLGALLVVSVARAYEAFYYHGAAPIPPGGTYNTVGYATREWNRACRTDNSGQMNVWMWHPDGYTAAHSGTQWTNCNQGVWVRLDIQGVFKAGCTNNGTVTFPVACQSTRP